MRWKIDQECTALEALAAKMPETSKSTLRACLEQSRVLVNDAIEKRGSTRLLPDTTVELLPKRKYLRSDVVILYEDDDLVLVDKPSGLLSVATDDGIGESLHSVLKRRFHRPMITPVHRLDREASGLLLFAYTPQAVDHLQEQFKDHSIDRHYVGLVHGRPPTDSGTWESHLLELPDLSIITVDPPEGRYACTHFELQKAGEARSLLTFRLKTGRKHQIRVHCATAGCPLVGDDRYGLGGKERLSLHATFLAFTHPKTGKRLKFNSPTPPTFNI